jgi:hypothetical protein
MGQHGIATKRDGYKKQLHQKIFLPHLINVGMFITGAEHCSKQ